MKQIVKDRTEHTPFLHLDGSRGIFSVFGRITVDETDDFSSFFRNLQQYLEEYRENIQTKTIFFFHIEYFGTHSETMFYVILGEICKMKDFTELIIVWYYQNDDEEETGYNFQEYFTDLYFEFVEISK